MKKKLLKDLLVIGWRETVALPELGIERIKTKVDTGARSSALHAYQIEKFEGENNKQMLRFLVHPYQKNTTYTITAEAELLEYRHVKNSGGHTQLRPVIRTIVKLGEIQWSIELTLTNRDVMGFRMLLGRQALRRRFLVDAGGSFLQSQPKTKKAKKQKKENL